MAALCRDAATGFPTGSFKQPIGVQHDVAPDELPFLFWAYATKMSPLTGLGLEFCFGRAPESKLHSVAHYLCKDGLDHVAIDIGKAIIAAVVVIGKPRVVNAHEVQNCGVQVVDMDFVLNGVPAKLVGRSMHHAAFDAATCHPHRETERMMLAAVRALGRWRATEFAAPQDKRVFEQAARFEVNQQGGNRLVHRGTAFGQFFAQASVMVPDVVLRRIK